MAKTKRPDSYTDIQAEVGMRIKWARELVEPNRSAFAKAMGVDRSTLQKIEDGDRAPSIFNVLDIANRLRVTPDYILMASLKGIDGELAGMLVARHPHLAGSSHISQAPDKIPKPKRPKRA